MTKIGSFKIQDSFKLTGRGLVALDQIMEGVVKIGAYLTFIIDNKTVVMKISGVEMADIDRPAGKFAVGLTFVYKSEEERNEFGPIRLKE
ncbi:MAG TPA: hypothetical protein VJ111_08590 [Chitinophagaceae bacterium]|nr:hypothetical protein [Chitinophagaceae bacterium]